MDSGFTQEVKEWWGSASPFDVSSFHAIMWDNSLTTESDKTRWVGQGIDFCGDDSISVSPSSDEEGATMISLLAKDFRPWGLSQSHGGPCGVLAAVQAELICLLLFGQRNPLDYPLIMEPGAMPNQADAFLTTDLLRHALAKAIAIVLARSAVMPSAAESSGSGNNPTATRNNVGVVLVAEPSPDTNGMTWESLDRLSTFTISPKDPASMGAGAPKRQKTDGPVPSREETVRRLASATAAFLLDEGPPGRVAPLESFRRPGGVMLLVMSLVASRGQDAIRSDMDDPIGTKLTSNFGHCGQELINLLLTGQAVSNVFDNTLTPSGELTCRGIQSRPTIGYLSQLESLRYCEVGGYYKSPKFPIWVVGSTSHFTILFGDASCLKESESDQLLEKCRRAFKAVEGGEENGFISSKHLGTVLVSLGLSLGGEHHYSTLAASLEVADSGIILWDDFWKATSRLMTGATIENVLNGDDDAKVDSPIILDGPDCKLRSAKIESDEEMAKRLASEWGSPNMDPMPVTTVAAPAMAAAPTMAAAAAPMEVEQPILSDEDLARQLQAEWDAEASGMSSGGASLAAVNGSQTSPQWSNFPDANSSIATPETTPMNNFEDTDYTKAPINKLEFETYGDSFQLFHYNGLRGGTLTPFHVTRLTPEEAVGSSIALKSGNSGSSGDLEDVVRTKWPSCAVNWLGRNPPYID